MDIDSLVTLSNIDSLEVVALENKLALMEYKFESLENSTDRILNALYFTIGVILAAVLGLNVWNWIGQTRRESQKFNELIESTKKNLLEEHESRISDLPNIISSMMSVSNSEFERSNQSLKSEILELKFKLLKVNSKYLTSGVDSEFSYLRQYVILAVTDYKKNKYTDFRVKDALKSMQELLENSDEFVFHAWADDFIKELETENFNDFSSYTEVLIPLLKKRTSKS